MFFHSTTVKSITDHIIVLHNNSDFDQHRFRVNEVNEYRTIPHDEGSHKSDVQSGVKHNHIKRSCVKSWLLPSRVSHQRTRAEKTDNYKKESTLCGFKGM